MEAKRYNRADLREYLVKNADLSKFKADQLISVVFDSIQELLCDATKINKGKRVALNISNFGNFTTSPTAERKARNVTTGEILQLPPSVRVSFAASPALKKAVKAVVKADNE